MSAKVRRYETITIDAREFRTEAGFLRAPVKLGRIGVLTYQHADGTSHKELRLPAEVFSEKSLESFELVPVVDSHPFENNGVVTPENAKRLQIGAVGHVRQDAKDPNWISGMISITDADAIKKVVSGKQEVSLGYFADREPAPPGSKFTDPVTGIEEPYDFIQRAIVGNHLAIVDQARAGSGARIQLDGLDAIAIDPRSPNAVVTKEKTMLKIILDGIEFEAAPQLAQAISMMQSKAKAHADGISAELTATQSKLKATEGQLATANDPKRIADAVAERVSVEKIADVHGIAHAGMDTATVRKTVIAKIDPEIKLDGQSDVWVNGLFTALTRVAAKANPAAAAITKATEGDKKPNLDSFQTRHEAFNKAIFSQDASTVLVKN